jgi:hypothetical protein
VIVTGAKSAYVREVMRIIFCSRFPRLLLSAVAFSGATLLVAVGCGGGSSSPGSPNGGSSGDTGGDTSSIGGASEGGTSSTGGLAATSGDAGQAGVGGEGGEAGEAPVLPPAKNHSAVSFVAAGAISTSKHFTLIGAVGESQGGTVNGQLSKSLKHTFIPGVIAAASP